MLGEAGVEKSGAALTCAKEHRLLHILYLELLIAESCVYPLTHTKVNHLVRLHKLSKTV